MTSDIFKIKHHKKSTLNFCELMKKNVGQIFVKHLLDQRFKAKRIWTAIYEWIKEEQTSKITY